MFTDEVRRKLEDIINGNVNESQADSCNAIRNHLCASFSTSRTVKKDFEGKSVIKEKQAEFLQKLASEFGFWAIELSADQKFLAEGGESKVYFDSDQKHVIKINDGVYYATWLEFFNSINIHNLLFPATAYTFIGFLKKNEKLHVVLKQPFIASDLTADLEAIKQFLTSNEFENVKRQDYFHKEFGLILEDMHDENVIQKDSALFFIDTVFYIVEPEAH